MKAGTVYNGPTSIYVPQHTSTEALCLIPLEHTPSRNSSEAKSL
jgi:hypothetical protein